MQREREEESCADLKEALDGVPSCISLGYDAPLNSSPLGSRMTAICSAYQLQQRMSQLNCLLLLLVRTGSKSTGGLPELDLRIMHTYAETILSEPKGIALRRRTVWYGLTSQDAKCSVILTFMIASQSAHSAKHTMKGNTC